MGEFLTSEAARYGAVAALVLLVQVLLRLITPTAVQRRGFERQMREDLSDRITVLEAEVARLQAMVMEWQGWYWELHGKYAALVASRHEGNEGEQV